MEEPKYTTGTCDGIVYQGCGRSNSQLHVFDWLCGVPGNLEETDFVEVQFKNTRKGYYLNSNHLELQKGDVVAVEANPGHDIGTVTLTGGLVLLQMKKARIREDAEVRRVYRKARPYDIDKYEEAKAREHQTMIESRQIAKSLGLEMKIGDVEYQGDGCKAIFYYIADGRVDFRQLIKVLADAFHIRIEMRQIGARQEAGRIGGIGPCGRELCCAAWLSQFVTVSTGAARFQDISPNPQKLAGQCAKLKCCMNYEVDAYVEAQKRFPARDIQLETAEGTWYFFKADILQHLITYSSDRRIAANLTTISTRRAFDVIALNKEGQRPEALNEEGAEENISTDLLDQDNIGRFDRAKKKKNKHRRDRDRQPQGNREAAPQGDGQQKDGKPQENRQPRGEKPNGGERRGDRPQGGDRSRRHGQGRPQNQGGKPSQGGEQLTIDN